jgi:sugar/nucleoside kinase (ribokinase family)
MIKIVTIGSALVDIFIHSSHFQMSRDQGVSMLCQKYGEKLEVESFEVFTGGGGTNTAVGFRRLGFDTAVIAETGRDAFSQLVENDLRQENVDTSLLIREKKEQTGGTVILVGQDGGRTALIHRGAAAELDVRDIPHTTLSRANWLHISSTGGNPEFLKAVFRLAKDNTIGVSWNPGQAELRLLGKELVVSDLPVKTLLLNAEEWASVAGIQDKLQAVVPEIVITDGSRGGQVLAPNQPYAFDSRQVTSVDDTGAGDAFGVGYVGARLRELPIEMAVQWGVANATSVVLRTGAKPGLLTRIRLEADVSSAHPTTS